MNKKTVFIAVLMLIIAITGCTTDKKAEKGPLRIGVDVFPGWAHIFIAQEKGIFKKNGVDVEIVLDEDYLSIQEQFANNELDGAFMVYADAIYINDQGIDAQVVYISDHSVTGDVIAAKPEYKSLEDLKGKKISVEGINSFSHLFVLAVLEKNGIKEGDVFIENVGAQEVVAALDRGDIVAGHTYGPGKYKAREKGYNYLAYAGDVKGIITDTLAFHKDVIKKRPDDVRAVVKSLFEAKNFQETNRKEALEILAKAINDTPESIGVGIDAVDYLDLERNAEVMNKKEHEIHEEDITHLYGSSRLISDFFLSRGQISKYPDYSSLVEQKFVNELLE
ncbi:ABC transporter substrate-binding protein [Elusimicrobiota bacterium]